jgi:hypothetical protein
MLGFELACEKILKRRVNPPLEHPEDKSGKLVLLSFVMYSALEQTGTCLIYEANEREIEQYDEWKLTLWKNARKGKNKFSGKIFLTNSLKGCNKD